MNNIKIGIVSSANYAKATVKVGFEDLGGKVSRDLPVLFPFVSKDKAFYMPKVGEQVLCLFLSNSKEKGFVLGSFYDANNATGMSGDMFSIKFEDGTQIKYDKASKNLDIACPGTINITGNLNINGNLNAGAMKIIDGVLTIDSDTTVTGALNVNGDTQVTGNLDVNGNINSTGSIIDTTGNTNNHTH